MHEKYNIYVSWLNQNNTDKHSSINKMLFFPKHKNVQ